MTVADAGDRATMRRAGTGGLPACLARLDDAIAAARTLGLDVAGAEAVRAEADARLGLSADIYVIGLVGGTGVGKSSLLNAIAGREVSTASVRRPTTERPLAWVPASSRAAAAPLLARLGVTDITDHDESAGTEALVVLDLPDVDSVEPRHRATVEELLPRLDAVVWVTDPEKYHDAVLHDDFLVRWLPRLDRQVVLVNKADRLSPDDAERVRRDLERDLRSGAGSVSTARPRVVLGSARDGEAGLTALKAWLDEGIEAKAVVAGRLGAAAATAIEELARAAGVDPIVAARPLLGPSERRAAVDRATDEVLRLVDLDGLERQAVAATRARARRRGAGPLGWLTALIYRVSGRESRVADPVGYLRRWRDRGSPVLAAEALRAAAAEPLRDAPLAVRPALAAATETGRLGERLTTEIDGAVAQQAGTRVPSSRLWPLIGLLQTVATLAILSATGWVVVWVLARPPVESVQVPVLGPVPMPYVALLVALLVGFLLARLLAFHAGWVGRGWARRLRDTVRAAIERNVADDAYAALDALEHARRALWIAARGSAECRGR